MSKDITIDVYFTVICDTCHNVLKATYDDRNHAVDVEPCKECIESHCEEKLEEYKKELCND